MRRRGFLRISNFFTPIGGYLAGSSLRSILVYDTPRMPRGRFSRKSKLLTQIGAYLGDFGPAEFDFEMYFSLRMHAHAQ